MPASTAGASLTDLPASAAGVSLTPGSYTGMPASTAGASLTDLAASGAGVSLTPGGQQETEDRNPGEYYAGVPDYHGWGQYFPRWAE